MHYSTVITLTSKDTVYNLRTLYEAALKELLADLSITDVFPPMQVCVLKIESLDANNAGLIKVCGGNVDGANYAAVDDYEHILLKADIVEYKSSRNTIYVGAYNLIADTDGMVLGIGTESI